MQRAVTCGELNGSKVTIDRSALMEFPSETADFVDADNDALYMTNGDLSVTNSVIGYTKDDGIDTGGNGGDNPYTAAADVTPYVSTNNWYEGAVHEGNSLSGTRNVTFTGCVFFNNGQGVEDGYSASATGDGPNALVDGCLFVSNMVGVRWGDNYGSGYSYNGSMEVKNSVVLNSLYKDAFSGQWHPTQANAWIYETTDLNTYGHKYFDVHDNYLSQPDALHHPTNTTWNAVANGGMIAPFMPVPGSNVGLAITSYSPAQSETSAYPGSFTVRLSTFSSRAVTVDWAVTGKVSAFADAETALGAGSVTFAPGETLKTVSAPVVNPGNYGLIRAALKNPVNAEVTGGAWYLKSPTGDPTLITLGATWKYLDNGSDQGTAWRLPGFNDSGWAAGPAQLGYGDGDEATTVGYVDADAVTAGVQKNATTYFRRTFNVVDKNTISQLALTLLYDDGGIVYINGTRVAATTGMPVDPAYNYYLGGTAPPDNSILNATIPASALVNGVNTIAVEIHQQSNSSSDISFDLQLVATFAPPLELHLTSAGGGPVLYWFDGSAVLEAGSDLGSWTPVPAGLSPFPFTPSVPRMFFRLRK
jgi:hypothetical protein